MKVLRDLNTKRSCQRSDTLTKIIKLNSNILSNLIYNHFNYCVDKGEFSNDLKHADIVPIYKKNKCEKENYGPVSILSNLSKIYEKLIYNQIYEYFDNIGFQVNVASRKGIVLNIVFYLRSKNLRKLLTEVMNLVLSEVTFPKHLII